MVNESEPKQGMKDLIQEERERRSKLFIDTLASAQQAQQDLEVQNHIKRVEDAARDNMHFLEVLRIPEYLQAIIDGDKLSGAYVLWWKRFPYSISTSSFDHCYLEQAERYDGSYGAKYLCGEGTLLSRISLVWNIGHITSVHSTSAVREGYGSGSWVSPGGAWDVTTGYKFQSVNIDGSVERQLLIIRGAPKFKFEYKAIMDNQLGYWQLQGDPKRIVDRGEYGFSFGYRYAEVTRCPTSPIVLRDKQLNPDVIMQTLASNYLDVRHSSDYTEVDRKGFGDGEFWPFDRKVPEIESR
ncbi:MAG: hypothetical protein PHV63_01345 [Candidatus Daviesbacteria bacterium]|nr:hypothetical protein [Candidatus Daviesbacteria bacterium]